MKLLTIVCSFSIIIFSVYAMLYTKKALYSIYYLILVFITATVVLFYLGIEFIAILYVLLYLGAIVVLYIISVYTLGSNLIDDFERTSNFRFNGFVVPLFFIFLTFFYDQSGSLIYFNGYILYVFFPDYFDILYQFNKNTDVLAFLIFDHYPLALLVGSLLLLIAMVGAIILTLHYLQKKKKRMFFDTAIPFQINLQDSATYGMEMIIQLHNYVMFLNVFIISVVIWFFFEIIAVTGFVQWFFFRVSFRSKTKLRLGQLIYLQINNAMHHMSTLEVIWTLLPVLALISIALPSLSMLYYFSLSFSPAVVINVIGHQWFWSYEYQPYNDGLTSIFPFVDSSKELFNEALNLSHYETVSDVDTNVLLNVYNDANEFAFRNMLNTAAHRRILNTQNVDLSLVQSSSNEEFLKYSFDSIMLQVEDLSYGSFRLLEVDKPLYLPVDTPIRVIVSSDDVLHSWAIPSLGVKIDCVPGRLNVVEFRIARTGVFYGQCSEICGTQHGFMPICIVSIPRKLFNFI